MSEAKGSVEPRESPYFGLDYYEEKFGAWFFGRETDGGKIITNLRAARLTLLHAESGVGKSSLLRAGVAWRMRRLADDSLARRGTARFVPVVFSSWKDDPVLELTGSIRTAIGPYLAGRPPPELPPDRLDAAIEAASDAVNANLLIMLDQFEEYFLYRTREPTPERFADQLAYCINRADLRANFLIAIREDAYAGLGDLFKGRIANVYGNYLHVEYLDRESAENAIREPLDVYNSQPGVEHVEIQDELVAAVLNQVRAIDGDMPQGQAAAADGAGDGHVATPLLQLVMETLWEQERAEGSHELRFSTLQDLRGVSVIVEAHLGKALGSLGSGGRQTAIDVFGHLVTPSGGKIAESVPDLAQVTGHSEDQVGSVLETLDQERIVRPVPAAPGQDPTRYRRYEIFHDVLAPAINRAIAIREEQRRTRRFRRLTALAAALLIVALAVAGGFAFLWHRVSAEESAANAEKLAAESRQLAAEADVNLTNDPELSALLALQALRLQDTSQAEEALRAALPDLQEMRTFQDETIVYSAAFDPVDANKVLSADDLGIAWIWDVKTGHRLVRLSAGGFSVTGGAGPAVFNPAGTEVAVAYADGTVAVFNARSGKMLRSADVAGSENVNNVEFVGSTGELAIASQKGLALWQLQNGRKCCDILSGEPAGVIAPDPRNPQEFAVTGANGTEAIWNISGSGRPQQRQLNLPSEVSVNDAAFSPDGSKLATADSDGIVRVYDLATLKTVMTFDAGEPSASSVAFSPDGKQIVAGYESGRARVWDTSTRLQPTLLAGSASDVDAVNFSPDGSEVVTASDDGAIRVWHAQPNELQTEFATSLTGGTPNPVDWAVYSTDGSRILASDSTRLVYIFTASGKRQAVINPGTTVETAAWNNSGTEVATAQPDGTVDVWHAVGLRYTQVHLREPIHLNGSALYMDMTPDGSRIAIVTSDDYYAIQVRSAQTGQLLQTLSSDHAISWIEFSPSGRQILTSDISGQVEVWDLPKGHRVLGAPGAELIDAEYDSSGSEFLTMTVSGVVTVWDARDDQPLRSIDASCPSPYSATPSPDGSKIAVSCEDGSVLVLDAATGQQLTQLPPTSAGVVETASFSPDGKSIVTAAYSSSDAGGVQIWSSELATPSLSALERLAEQRITRQLTPAERAEYLTGISG